MWSALTISEECMSGVTEQFYWMGDEKVSFCQATFC